MRDCRVQPHQSLILVASSVCPPFPVCPNGFVFHGCFLLPFAPAAVTGSELFRGNWSVCPRTQKPASALHRAPGAKTPRPLGRRAATEGELALLT